MVEAGGVPPTTSGLSKPCGSSVNMRRPSEDEPVGVVDADVDVELGVDDDEPDVCRLILFDREGVLDDGP